MNLKQVESQRSELLLLVILLLMIFLGAIAYISFRQEQGFLVPALTIISLLACLYIISKERRLKKLQHQLTKKLIEEQDKSTSLESRLKEITGLYRAISTVNPNRKIFEARKRETAALGTGEKLVLGHPLAATIGDSARCMQNLEKVLFTGPKTSDTVTFICD